MKNLITSILTLIILAPAFAAPVIKATKSGNWSTKADWDLKRLPASNDTVVIADGVTMLIDANIKLDNIVLKIYGTLKLAGGKLTINDYSTFVIETSGKLTGGGNNDQVKLGNDLLYKGSEGTIFGYAYADNTTGGEFAYSNMILPVKFLSFTAIKNNNRVEIKWTTATEINNSHFEVERSNNGRDWSIIAIVMPAQSATSINQYSYTDKVEGTNDTYYRIRQVDMNGNQMYSSVKVISSKDETAEMKVIAGADNSLTVKIGKSSSNNIVSVIGINGQVVHQQAYSDQLVKIRLNSAIHGVYVVKVTDAKGISEVKRVLL
jgi:hypothetical protein